MPDVISGVIIALVTSVTIIWRWQRYEKNRNDQIKLEKNYAKTRKSVEKSPKCLRKSHFASKNGDFNTRFAFITCFFQHKPYILIRRPSQRAFQECEKQDNDIKFNTMKKLKYLGIVYMVLKYIRLFLLVKEMFM